MSVDFPDDVQRFLELLLSKIGFNALARFSIHENNNRLLKTVRYRVASPQTAPDTLSPPWSPSGELQVNANLIAHVYSFATAHENELTPFGSSQMIFHDVQHRQDERVQTFILLFLAPSIV